MGIPLFKSNVKLVPFLTRLLLILSGQTFLDFSIWHPGVFASAKSEYKTFIVNMRNYYQGSLRLYFLCLKEKSFKIFIDLFYKGPKHGGGQTWIPTNAFKIEVENLCFAIVRIRNKFRMKVKVTKKMLQKGMKSRVIKPNQTSISASNKFLFISFTLFSFLINSKI